MTGAEEQHTVAPGEPWWHPHHVMHHGREIAGSVALVLVAVIGYWGIKRKLKGKA